MHTNVIGVCMLLEAPSALQKENDFVVGYPQ